MALVTASDYQTAMFKIFQVSPAVSLNEWVRAAGLSSADASTLLSQYNSWLLTVPDRIHETHQTNAH